MDTLESLSQIKPHSHKKPPRKLDPYVNLPKALMCSFGFFGLYTAIYGAQNIQTAVFLKDGFGNLGFYANAVAYVGQGTGSLFCGYVHSKVSYVRSMAISSVLNIPNILFLILPAMKYQDLASTSPFFSNVFVYTITLITSLLNGLGQGVEQPSSGTYISDCATEKNKGFFFALFWSFYMGS